MLLLALDTATPAGSVALMEDERLLAGRYFDAGLHHSRQLFVEMEGALGAADREPGEVAAVAVTIGPGSFTGLRIGLSAAKGFCLARDAALVPVPTLEALAARLPFSGAPVLALLDARRGEVYAGLYDTAGGAPRRLQGPRADTPEAIAADWIEGPVVCTGDGAAAHGDVLSQYVGAAVAPPHCQRPDAAAVAWLGGRRLAAGQVADVAAVEPEYLRTPSYRRAGGAA